MTKARTMSASDLRRIAVLADCDPRTVKREVARPGSITMSQRNSMLAERLKRAIEQHRRAQDAAG